MNASSSRTRYSFRPPWWAVLLAALGCAAGLALGHWQSGRAAEKRAAAAAVQPLSLRGEFLPRFTVYLDNKVHRGRPGYQVLQPLRLADGRHVLVNRGWIAGTGDRRSLPALRTPTGSVALDGIRLERLPHAFEPSGAPRQGQVWQNATVAEFAAWSGLALEPWVLEQHSTLDDGLVRDWTTAGAGAEKNDSYALQWYSLSALCLVLLVALNLKHDKA
jgi:surfeit locus 1 family protein